MNYRLFGSFLEAGKVPSEHHSQDRLGLFHWSLYTLSGLKHWHGYSLNWLVCGCEWHHGVFAYKQQLRDGQMMNWLTSSGDGWISKTKTGLSLRRLLFVFCGLFVSLLLPQPNQVVLVPNYNINHRFMITTNLLHICNSIKWHLKCPYKWHKPHPLILHCSRRQGSSSDILFWDQSVLDGWAHPC